MRAGEEVPEAWIGEQRRTEEQREPGYGERREKEQAQPPLCETVGKDCYGDRD